MKAFMSNRDGSDVVEITDLVIDLVNESEGFTEDMAIDAILEAKKGTFFDKEKNMTFIDGDGWTED